MSAVCPREVTAVVGAWRPGRARVPGFDKGTLAGTLTGQCVQARSLPGGGEPTGPRPLSNPSGVHKPRSPTWQKQQRSQARSHWLWAFSAQTATGFGHRRRICTTVLKDQSSACAASGSSRQAAAIVVGQLPGGPQPRDTIQAELGQRPGQLADHGRAVHALHPEARERPDPRWRSNRGSGLTQ